MQGEAALARLGGSARESAPYRGMVRTALGIVQEEGFLKLWQGVTPAIYRHVGIYLDSAGKFVMSSEFVSSAFLFSCIQKPVSFFY